jgi:hypothetical protein
MKRIIKEFIYFYGPKGISPLSLDKERFLSDIQLSVNFYKENKIKDSDALSPELILDLMIEYFGYNLDDIPDIIEKRDMIRKIKIWNSLKN